NTLVQFADVGFAVGLRQRTLFRSVVRDLVVHRGARAVTGMGVELPRARRQIAAAGLTQGLAGGAQLDASIDRSRGGHGLLLRTVVDTDRRIDQEVEETGRIIPRARGPRSARRGTRSGATGPDPPARSHGCTGTAGRGGGARPYGTPRWRRRRRLPP